MSKIIVLNSPPNSGKDTVADYISSNYGFKKIQYKDFSVKLMLEFFKVEENFFYTELYTRENKEKPSEFFKIKDKFLSPREALIYFSEEIIKKNFGKDYFGKLLAKSLKRDTNYIISDAGFNSEITALLEFFSEDEIYILQIHRLDCDFSKDSRDYITLPRIEKQTLLNNGSLKELFNKVDLLFK